jgi:hypothetical protein
VQVLSTMIFVQRTSSLVTSGLRSLTLGMQGGATIKRLMIQNVKSFKLFFEGRQVRISRERCHGGLWYFSLYDLLFVIH